MSLFLWQRKNTTGPHDYSPTFSFCFVGVFQTCYVNSEDRKEANEKSRSHTVRVSSCLVFKIFSVSSVSSHMTDSLTSLHNRRTVEREEPKYTKRLRADVSHMTAVEALLFWLDNVLSLLLFCQESLVRKSISGDSYEKIDNWTRFRES